MNTEHPFTLEELREQEKKFQDRLAEVKRPTILSDHAKAYIKSRKELNNLPEIDKAFKNIANRYYQKIDTDLDISFDDGRKLLWQIMKLIAPEFKVTNHNKPIIQSLIKYFLRHRDCEYDLTKGLYLYGNVGRGKSTLMELFSKFTEGLRLFPFQIVSCKKIAFDISQSQKTESMSNYFSGHYCFDDFGYEESYKLFGNDINVMEEIMVQRYDKNNRTFVTTNLKPDDIAGKYGMRMASRALEMFNFIFLDGPDYRES